MVHELVSAGVGLVSKVDLMLPPAKSEGRGFDVGAIR
jgi:hypothetical protein